MRRRSTTTTEDAAPAPAPAPEPETAAERRCCRLRDAALSRNVRVRFLFDEIAKLGCDVGSPFGFVRCASVERSGPLGDKMVGGFAVNDGSQKRYAPGVVVVAAYSFWVPQIVRNAKLNAREPVCDAYLYGMAASRLLLPLYCLCDPDGLPRVLVVPSPAAPTYGARAAFALVLVGWQGVQVGLLKLQQHYGARCFVPAALIPKPYDYQRDPAHILRAAGSEGPECAICMGPVNAVTGEFMVTPCDHMFHEICLRQWMDLKMECPVCRAALPPTPNDDEAVSYTHLRAHETLR